MAYQMQRFVFNCPSRRGSMWPALNMTAKRYRAYGASTADGLTLFFFHGIGGHKEEWEPVIESLFSQSGSNTRIREAWAFDWPTHGEAGVLNRGLLEKRTESVPAYDWVLGVVQLLRSEYMQRHRVVLCGHSAGATTAVLAAAEFYPDLASVGIIGLILVESTMMTLKVSAEGDFQTRLTRMITLGSSRRDNWKSRQDALLYFQNKRPWSKWDPKVLFLYVEHGLYEHPDGTVTLKCDKKRELNGFVDQDPHLDGMACLGKLCCAMPVHTIWGERQDYIPALAQTALSDASEGRFMASVTKVERAGHMVVQEQPVGLARAICRILETIPSVERSKL